MATRDEEARRAILAHHDELADGVRSRVAALVGAVAAGDAHETARSTLAGYLAAEVLPHAVAEEASLYPAAGRAGLADHIDAMVAEHRWLEGTVALLDRSDDPAEAVALGAAVAAVFARHVSDENDVVLPALLSAEGFSLADLLADMHAHYSAAKGVATDPGETGGSGAGDPELDVRELAPARRHQVIFTAYGALGPAAGFVLVNDHDPRPLRYQLAAEHPDEFTWDYLESGPSVWRVRIGKVPAPHAA